MAWGEPIIHADSGGIRDESNDLYWKRLSFKGVQEIISKLQKLVDENGLSDKVDLNGAFCSGNCDHGVCVTVEGELYSLKPEDTEEFFENEIKGRL